MAIKITKKPTIKRYKAKCPICGCEFEFDTTDANWQSNLKQDNNTYGYYAEPQKIVKCYINCPICRTYIEDKQTEIE